MAHSRVCSATVSSLVICTGIALVVYIVALTLTDLEKFNEIPTEELIPMPVLVCFAALLAMVGGNLGFTGSVYTCCIKPVPMLWAVSCVVIAILMEIASIAALYSLVDDDEMDQELQDIYYEVKLSTSLVVGIVLCLQLASLDYYLYLLDMQTLCFRSYMCWPACFSEELDGDAESLIDECPCSENGSEHRSEQAPALHPPS